MMQRALADANATLYTPDRGKPDPAACIAALGQCRGFWCPWVDVPGGGPASSNVSGYYRLRVMGSGRAVVTSPGHHLRVADNGTVLGSVFLVRSLGENRVRAAGTSRPAIVGMVVAANGRRVHTNGGAEGTQLVDTLPPAKNDAWCEMALVPSGDGPSVVVHELADDRFWRATAGGAIGVAVQTLDDEARFLLERADAPA